MLPSYSCRLCTRKLIIGYPKLTEYSTYFKLDIPAQLLDLPEFMLNYPIYPNFQLNYPIHPSLNSCSSLMYRSPNLTVRFACFWKIGVKSRVGAPQKIVDSRGEILISLTLVFWSIGGPKAKWGFFPSNHNIHKSLCGLCDRVSVHLIEMF